jgi:hypothetical protein
MDSVDDWEEFSSGYSYRVDAGIGGNKKPQCVKPTAYNCGKACINIMKSCKIKTDDPTIKDRLKKLEGIGKNYAKTVEATPKVKAEKPPVLIPELKPEPKKTNPVVKKQQPTSLIGDGTHDGAPKNAQEYYDAMAKSGKPITKKEAEEVIESVRDWTDDSYKTRDDQKAGVFNQNAENIASYIKNSTPYKGSIYRGLKFDSEQEAMDWIKGEGNVLDNQSAHASWTSSQSVAIGFSNILYESKEATDGRRVIIKAVNKTGASARDISEFPDQDEVVISKDARHRVKSFKKVKGYILVEVEEIEPSPEKKIPNPKKPEPEAEKQPVKNLAGDGTHESVPKNAEEYYDAVTKTGKQITLKEAQDTANAIKYWTGKGSSEIREDQKNGRENRQADQIDEFIKNSTPYKGEIYRGITFSSEDEAMKWAKGDKDGIVGNQSAHSSWTSDIAIAAHFTELDFSGEKSTQVIIKSTNKSGASIRNLSVFGKPEAGKLGRDEKEVVVSKNTRHKFKGVTKKDGILYVEVEEVDTPIEKPAKQEEVKSQEEVKAQQQPPVRKVGKLTPSLEAKEDQIKTAEEWSSTAKQFKIKGNKVLNALSEDNMIGGKKVDRKALKNMLELVSDSSIVIDGLIFYAQEKPGKQDTIFLKDESGDAQGFFMVGNEKSKDSMYIEFLGTNPLNIIQSKKGVGKQIMYQAIQESIKRGLKGQIKLESLSTSESFYEAMGFQRRTEKIFEDGKYYDMEYFDLSEESAKAFVKEYEKKLKQDKI